MCDYSIPVYDRLVSTAGYGTHIGLAVDRYKSPPRSDPYLDPEPFPYPWIDQNGKRHAPERLRHDCLYCRGEGGVGYGGIPCPICHGTGNAPPNAKWPSHDTTGQPIKLK